MKTPSDIIPMLQTIKGSELNGLVDQYLSDGVDTNKPLADLIRQQAHIKYILGCNRSKETRLSFEEVGRFESMSHTLAVKVAQLQALSNLSSDTVNATAQVLSALK